MDGAETVVEMVYASVSSWGDIWYSNKSLEHQGRSKSFLSAPFTRPGFLLLPQSFRL
jgi:hypothetical protein